MTLLACTLAALLLVTVLSFTSLLRSQQRAHARREDLLLNQLLHAAGKTWQQPPRDTAPELEPLEREPPRFVAV